MAVSVNALTFDVAEEECASPQPPITMRHLRCTAFLGDERVAAGELRHVALQMKRRIDAGADAAAIHLFDDRDGYPVQIDWSGSQAQFLRRLAELPAQGAGAAIPRTAAAGVPDEHSRKRGRGRPRLGVVAREVTLLPQHWQWLNVQPGGASMALRRLVEAARHDSSGQSPARRSQEAAYRFMQDMLADVAGFEQAARALFAGDAAAFDEASADWPDDIREHALLLGKDALQP